MNDAPPSKAPSGENGRPDAAGPSPLPPLFARLFTKKEQKSLFLYVVVCIVLLEFAITVGAVIISFTNAQRLPSGMLQPRFPLVGYLVAVILAPVLVMLILHLFSLGFGRQEDNRTLENLPDRAATFYALVRGAPAVILFAAFVLLGAAIYYLDGVMALLLKLGDSFGTIAIWVVAAFTAAWIVSYAVRAYFAYKARQMEAEYAFRREVLERTGMIMLDAKHAPDVKLLPMPPQALPPTQEERESAAALITVEPGADPAPDSGMLPNRTSDGALRK